LTFDEPFQSAGNGYLSIWASFLAAVWFVESLGGYRNAALTTTRLLEDLLGGSLTGGEEGGSEAGAVELDFDGVKPK